MSQNNKPSIFIQFAGQGVKYLEELRRLYNTYPAIQPFIQEASTVVLNEASQYDDSQTGFFSQGLDVKNWIENPDSAPELGYLLSSPLSHPFIYLCQISTYISVLLEGVDPQILLNHTHSATGFSTGVVAGVVASVGNTVEETKRVALKVLAMFFWQGVRCQQSMANYGIDGTLQSDLLNSKEGSPSCMAAIGNMEQEELLAHMKTFSDYGTTHLAYELLSDRNIIAGMPENLNAFHLFLKNNASRFSWRYTSSTIAAHCPFLRYSLETSPQDAERIGLRFQREDMLIPVWSNDTGEDIRDCKNIVWEVMRAYFTRPAFWKNQIRPLLSPGDIAYVLDFGPGTGVASLTEGYTKESPLQVIRCTVPLGRKKLIEEIIPSLEA